MLQNKMNFHKNDFLKSGSVFAFKNKVWLMWGKSEFLESRPDKPSVCSCDFFLEEHFLWNEYPNQIECTKEEAITLLSGSQSLQMKTSWYSPEKDKFSQQYTWIQDGFSKGEIQKAVPYIFENGNVENGEEYLLEMILLHSLNHLTGFLYGEWKDNMGRLGMTPEILIEQRSKKDFSTMAVAGTTTLHEFEKNNDIFLNNKKENKEHDWVVDDLRKVLSPMGQVTIEDRGFVKTLDLVHIRTKVQLKTQDEVQVEDLVRALHPTAALGAFPRDKNKEVMGKLNQMNKRGAFGAPFGFSISEEEVLFVVAIRNIEWKGSALKIGAGCGVVPESNIDSEWQELKNKRQSVKQIFGLL